MTDAQKRFIYILLTMLSGPLLNILSRRLHLASEDVKDLLDALSAVTVLVGSAWGFTTLNATGLVRSAATLSPAETHAALGAIADEDKVKIAAAVPDVATIVVRPTATNGLAAAAQDPAQPKVIQRILVLLMVGGLLLGAGGGLTACATNSVPPTQSGLTLTELAKSAFAARAGYAAALSIANSYAALPRCEQPTSPKICSKQTVVDAARKADLAADVATSNAETAVRTLGSSPQVVRAIVTAASASVDALQKINAIYGSN